MNTVTHTTALRLKEAGWEKETERFYVGQFRKSVMTESEIPPFVTDAQTYPAPTFAEIWAELPDELNGFYLTLETAIIGYICFNRPFEGRELPHENNITEAAAELWLALKSEGLI